MLNEQIIQFLRHIPQSNQHALEIRYVMRHTLSDTEHAALCGYAHMLHTLGIVDFDPVTTQIRARSQTAKYALNSLAAYTEDDMRIIEDWKTRGLSSNNLANGASFLYALEQRRLHQHANAMPSRHEKVAQVIIKRDNPHTGEPEIFFQYDANAQRYQLIGGRWSPQDGSELLHTIIREIAEELPDHHLEYGQDYDLELMIQDFAPPPMLSPTFGALTEYHFHIYHMTHLRHELHEQAENRWVPIYQVRQGIIIDDSGRGHTLDTALYTSIDAHIEGGLTGLPNSYDL